MPGQTISDPQPVIGHISADCPDINHYKLLGNGGAATLTGFFVTRSGRQTGIAISRTIPVGNGSNDPVTIGATIPADAVGFIGNLSSAVKWSLYDATDDTAIAADFKANYANYPNLGAADSLRFGAVAVI